MEERTYIIPLRQAVLNAPKYKRAKKAVNATKAFLSKHMKTDEVKLGKHLNEEIWKNGIKNPPGKVKITVFKDKEGVAKAELFGHKYVEKKAEEDKKESKPEDIKAKLQKLKAASKKTEEDEPAEKEPEKKAEAKPAKKEEKPAEEKKPAPAKKE